MFTYNKIPMKIPLPTPTRQKKIAIILPYRYTNKAKTIGMKYVGYVRAIQSNVEISTL